jgi:hypothetical protein
LKHFFFLSTEESSTSDEQNYLEISCPLQKSKPPCLLSHFSTFYEDKTIKKSLAIGKKRGQETNENVDHTCMLFDIFWRHNIRGKIGRN